jgi:predicted polyphosphate/ATP-dependent NAD kinase
MTLASIEAAIQKAQVLIDEWLGSLNVPLTPLKVSAPVKSRPELLVGIVTNPEAGHDVRRLFGASVFPTSEKISMVIRVLAALGVFGVEGVLMMPDHGGIAAGVLQAVRAHSAASFEPWPEVFMIDQNIERSAYDTRRAVRAMLKKGVRLIIVLGGDGTHRVVASECGHLPLVTLSTGTNNAFPDCREATTAGIAAGLCASGRLDVSQVCRRNKRLKVRVGDREEIALVDVAICLTRYIGSKALWDSENLEEVFVTFSRCDSLGLSSIPGLLHPTSRDDSEGTVVRFDRNDPKYWLSAPIAPGLIKRLPVHSIEALPPGVKFQVTAKCGTIALDGEREIEFTHKENPLVWLDREGPLTVDVHKTLELAANQGLLVSSKRIPDPQQTPIS